MGLYRQGDPWNAVLRRYKDAPVAAARRYFADLLGCRVEHFLSLHGPCLDRETGGFDAYCVVPSSRAGGVREIVTAPHPLESVLERIPRMRSLRVVRLAVGEDPAGHLRPSKAAFVADRIETDSTENGTRKRVLVVDDSWVTGARALSAVTALNSVGTPVAGVLVLGRYVDTSASSRSRSWWDDHAGGRAQSTSDERCCMRVCLARLTPAKCILQK
jgi:hypothetical protein